MADYVVEKSLGEDMMMTEVFTSTDKEQAEGVFDAIVSRKPSGVVVRLIEILKQEN